ncbi:MAG: tetratricopeptide repeat protein [Terriglobia bacterium]
MTFHLDITDAHQSLSTLCRKIKPSGLRSRLPGHGLWLALLFAVIPGVAAPRRTPYTFAMVEFQSGHFQQARQALEEALRRSPATATAEMEMLVARCDFELGDLNGATAHAEQAVRIDPTNAQYHLWLGRMVGSEAGRERSVTLAMKTRKEFEEAVKLAPSNADARRALMEYYLDAPWILGGSKAKAEEQAAAISQIDPIEGLLARARMDQAAGQPHQADSDYRQAIQAKPQRLGPYFEAANFYLRRHDADGLTQAVEGAAAVNASDPRIEYYRGVAHVLAGTQLASAQRELEDYLANAQARRNFPSHADALSWLGKLYERTRRTQLAVQQ